MELTLLCLFAFVAGFVDAIAGGGGLIQLPALFLFLPPGMAASVPLVFGTNKFASMCGTSVAVAQYARRVAVPWRSIAPAAAVAFVFSAVGAQFVQSLPASALKPLVLVLLVAVAIYTQTRKDFGDVHRPRFVAEHERWLAMFAGMVIGFYDGFFGPGTGSFLMFLFISRFGFDFLTASASAKVINLATNVAAVIAFAWAGCVAYEFAVPMALANVLGGLAGSRLAVLKGNRFVRVFFLVIVSAMIVRFAWELFLSPAR